MDKFIARYKPKMNYPANLICDIFQNISRIDQKNFEENLTSCAGAVGIPQKNMDVLNMIYKEKKTYSEVGEKYGVTKEAVRCLKERTLAKLRKEENIVFFEIKQDPVEKGENEKPLEERLFDEDIGRVGFQNDIVKRLEKIGVTKISQLAVMDRSDIRKLKGVGSTGAVRIENVLTKIGVARPSLEIKKAVKELMVKYKLSFTGMIMTVKYLEGEQTGNE